jgi:hypothetical protein
MVQARTMKKRFGIPILAAAVLAAGCGLVLELDDLEHPVDILDGGGEADSPGEADRDGEDGIDIEAADEHGAEGEAEADPPVDDGPGDPLPDDACPPDDPLHRIISVSGIVNSIFTTGGTGEEVGGLHIALYSALDVYMDPDIPPLAAGTIEAGPSDYEGTFDLSCVDVHNVIVGLVALVDEEAGSTTNDFFPTATLILQESGSDMEDEETGQAVAVIDDAVDVFAFLISDLDPDSGFIVGMVADPDSFEGIGGASVTSTGTGVTVNYLDESLMSLRTDGKTASHGIFVIAGPVTMTQLTAQLSGYVFDSPIAATVNGICTFTTILGSASP